MTDRVVVKNYKGLEAWKRAMDLAERVYAATRGFPKEERYGLTLQIRRAAVSVPSNIAEGAARYSRKEFVQFVYVALGSLSELETRLMLADRMGLLLDKMLFSHINQIRQLLFGLVRFLRRPRITDHGSRITGPP